VPVPGSIEAITYFRKVKELQHLVPNIDWEDQGQKGQEEYDKGQWGTNS